MSSVAAIPFTPDEDGRRRGYDRFRVTGWIEPGEWCGGRLRVSVTEPVSEGAATLAAITGNGWINPGQSYTKLRVDGRLWMSDTPDEYRDHVFFIGQATGRVLIHGLGLGCALKAILHKPNVTYVDVVEIDERVLAVVGPYYAQDPRVNLICDDALTRRWPTGARWDAVWHDIWADKCEDDRDERSLLNRRFGRRSAWQGGWAQEELDARRRREHAMAWW